MKLKVKFHQGKPIWTGLAVAALAAIAGCTNVTTSDYEAAAKTIYTWQVRYSTSPSRRQERLETFASNSLLNRNGQKPEGAVTDDDKGLWWPAMPARPTLDEIEGRSQPGELASKPELLRDVEYKFTYRQGNKTVTLPANYDVYRQVVKVYPEKVPLQLTLGINDASVEKAEPAK